MISNTLEDQKCQINIIRLRNAINELNKLVEKAKDPVENNKTNCSTFNKLFSQEKIKN